MKTVTRLGMCLLVVLTLYSCGAPRDVAPVTKELSVSDPPAPTQRIEIPLGAEVNLIITTTKADKAHLHGYEVVRTTEPGKPTELKFTANMAGSYELESHVTNTVWANIVVA